MALVVGLVYDHDENWIAGTYYIENLILALATVPGEKPLLKIYAQKEELFDRLKKRTGYPNIAWARFHTNLTLADRVINKVSTLLTGRYWSVPEIDEEVDFLFTDSDSLFFERVKKKLFWIPDFQEKHYPFFFSPSQIDARRKRQIKVIKANWPIVFSSKNAHRDFKELYPQAKNLTFVMPFAVTLPNLDGIHIDEIKLKYGITGEYFLCSNQFWKHKNHTIVLEALVELKKSGRSLKILFTGKPHDFRNPGFFDELKQFVEENDLNDSAFFLGFIDRNEQLVLMKNCIAVIQPSLFEGWSTSVEDAKALNKPIIASDIPVHREQLNSHYAFFDKGNARQLAKEIIKMMDNMQPIAPINYKDNIRDFGKHFLRIAEQIREQ